MLPRKLTCVCVLKHYLSIFNFCFFSPFFQPSSSCLWRVSTFLCQDYIYDKDIEIIAKEEQRKAWKMQGLVFRSSVSWLCLRLRPLPSSGGTRGEGRSPTPAWSPASSGGARESTVVATVSWTCAFAWVLTGPATAPRGSALVPLLRD